MTVVQRLMADAYSPDCATDSYVRELLQDVGNAAEECGLHKKPQVSGLTHQPVSYLDLTKHRGTVGLQINVNVIGQVSGTVYGSSIYSDDSDINTAAVHAGVVNVGEPKVLTVVTKGPQKRCIATLTPFSLSKFLTICLRFMGSSRNGVKTLSFSAWPGSFSFKRSVVDE